MKTVYIAGILVLIGLTLIAFGSNLTLVMTGFLMFSCGSGRLIYGATKCLRKN